MVDYLLVQNITESYFSVWGEDDNSEYYLNNINISKEDLESLFAEMVKGNLEKRYYSGMGDTTPDIVIKYVVNQEEYILRFKSGIDIVSENENWDNELLNLLDKEVDSIDGEKDNHNPYFTYSYDWDAETYMNNLIEN